MTRERKKKLQDAIRELRELYYKWVAEEIRSSNRSYSEIGRLYGVSEGTVYQIARLHGLSRTHNDVDVPSTSGQGGEDGGD
jgi:DNA-directed RNA polymerase specialized sigma subunit